MNFWCHCFKTFSTIKSDGILQIPIKFQLQSNCCWLFISTYSRKTTRRQFLTEFRLSKWLIIYVDFVLGLFYHGFGVNATSVIQSKECTHVETFSSFTVITMASTTLLDPHSIKVMQCYVW